MVRIIDAARAAACGRGRRWFSAARKGVVAVMDDDVIPRSDWLEKLVAAYAEWNVVAAGERLHAGAGVRIT